MLSFSTGKVKQKREGDLPVNQQRREEDTGRNRRYALVLLSLVLALVGAVLFSFWAGYYPLTPLEVVRAFLTRLGWRGDLEPNAMTIFWKVRLPRILAAALIGASLSTAGAAYQSMFRNPLVSPDILGVSSGAGFGAALAILSGASGWMVQLCAFSGGLAAVALTYLVSSRTAHAQTLSLVLTGTMVSALCNAGVSMVKYLSEPSSTLQQITFWLMGSLQRADMASLGWSFWPMAAGLTVLFLLRWRINLLTLEEEEARSLGIDTALCRRVLILASTLVSAAAVCLGGLIGWVGLMIPHMARALVGADCRRLIPACALLGAAYLVLMDDLARAAFSLELPLGVVTSVMGAPFFMLLILKRKGR